MTRMDWPLPRSEALMQRQHVARYMSMTQPVQVLAVTGGKGGVGKTSVSINLGLALVELGRRVVLLDADLGLANIDVTLGLTPKFNLADVLAGQCDLADILIEGPGGLRIIPASSGTQSMVNLVSCIKLTVDMRAFDAHAPLLSKSPQHFLSIRTVFYLRYVFR